MNNPQQANAVQLIRDAAYPLAGEHDDFQPLIAEVIQDANFILIGEASHGTREFYETRAEITKQLITQKTVAAVAVEADWPDAYRVNRYVRGHGKDTSPDQALQSFQRFPAWMWRNKSVLDFIQWLREHNRVLAEHQKTGFYGIDLYSLYASMQAVIAYLMQVDPQAAERARERYECFDYFGDDPQRYGYEAAIQLSPTCEEEVVNQLVDLQKNTAMYLSRDGILAEDEAFNAQQNAQAAADAENYYRQMYKGDVETWNIRDRHMANTIHALAEHLARRTEPKIVVWEHNSHIGDARATDMLRRNEINVGQLIRQAHPRETVAVGFTTATGAVSAASNWDGPVQHKTLRPPRPDSYELLFHKTGIPAFELHWKTNQNLADALEGPFLERAVGVIYRPETEFISHYLKARITRQFDAVIHFDETRAVEPLEPTAQWLREQRQKELVTSAPETFPFGV